MGLHFNRFSINSHRWKNAISTGNFYCTRICLIFFQFYSNGGNQKLTAWSFQLRKNYFCVLNIKRPIAHQSSITFFLIHPIYNYFAENFGQTEVVPDKNMVVYYNGYSIKQLKKALKNLKSANGDLCEIRYLSQILRNRLRQNNNVFLQITGQN